MRIMPEHCLAQGIRHEMLIGAEQPAESAGQGGRNRRSAAAD